MQTCAESDTHPGHVWCAGPITPHYCPGRLGAVNVAAPVDGTAPPSAVKVDVIAPIGREAIEPPAAVLDSTTATPSALSTRRQDAHATRRDVCRAGRRGAVAVARRSPAILGAVIALVLGLGGGGADAYFTSHGSGTGHATAGTLQAVTVQAATVSPSTPLFPGVTGDVVLNVNNPNALALSLVSVSYGTITAVGGIGTCTTTGITLNTPTNLPYALPSGTTSVDLLGAATMGSSSQTGCQGATFSIPVTITVHEG
jgi:hypothetical protein